MLAFFIKRIHPENKKHDKHHHIHKGTMSFSNEWDQTYKDNAHQSIWPWSNLVSLVMRYARPSSTSRVLELGCGAGANIPFFEWLKVDYHSIEGSETIVKMLQENFPVYKDTLVAGDFTKPFPFEGQFDLIVDRASITHNSTTAIKRAVGEVYKSLKPGGQYIGINWFSTDHYCYKLGEQADDVYTRTKINAADFSGLGNVHFSDEGHLRDLFKDFELEFLTQEKVQHFEPNKYMRSSWDIIVKKPV